MYVGFLLNKLLVFEYWFYFCLFTAFLFIGLGAYMSQGRKFFLKFSYSRALLVILSCWHFFDKLTHALHNILNSQFHHI